MKKDASKIGKKCLVGLLAMTMSIGIGKAVSNAQNATGTLGVCNIANPTKNQATNTFNYVYFGKVPSEGTFASEFDSSVQGNPILWRVLNTTANGYDQDTGETAALFMLTEYSLPTKRAWDNTSPYGQVWDDYYTTGDYKKSDTYEKKVSSTVRGFLQGIESGGVNTWANGNGFYQKCFSGEEQAAIMTTVKTSETMKATNRNGSSSPVDYYPTSLTNPTNSTEIKWYNSSSNGDFYAFGCPLRGDTVFLLSAKEATNPDYGFSNATTSNDSTYTYTADNNRICKQNVASGGASWWWLRSA